MLGVFPATGQNLILLGKPFANRADIQLSNNRKIEIIKHGDGATVKKILFRGAEVSGYRIPATDFMDGGVIAEEGTPSQIFQNPQSPRLQQFLKAVL